MQEYAILSSSLKPICIGIAQKLNIDNVLCSEIESKNGLLTGRPIGRLCFREEKAIRLAAYCKLNNMDPADAWYYGDSISDLPALSIVGNPICINADSQLKKIAIKRNWKTLSWKN
jgi:HAD superfamily phosphoserine phosphatase-like hydrolase